MNNFNSTFVALLKELKVKVTKSSALEFLETHPDEQTLLAYSDALDKWKIENAALRITKDQLIEMPTPFLSFSRKNGGTFSLVRKYNEEYIEKLDTESGWLKESHENFFSDWTGVVMLAEAAEESGERNFSQKRKEERLRNIRIPLALIFFALALILILIANPLINSLIYTFLVSKMAFAAVATLLLAKGIDAQNSLLNKLCNNGSKFSCQSILESDAAKLTPWLTWADMGFIYAYGSLAALLIEVLQGTVGQPFIFNVFIFSLLGSGFSVYSIYYQGIKAKIWCPLCLAFIALFWVELGLSSFFFSFSALSFSALAVALPFLIGFILSSAFLLLYKNEAIKAKEGDAYKIEIARLKSNPDVFQALMHSQPEMPHLPKGMGVLEFGNPEAENTLLVVTNPQCSHCAKMHKRVERVLEETQNLKYQVLFLTNPDGYEQDYTARVARLILSLPKDKQQEALNAWFERNDGNYTAWQPVYSEYPEKEIASLWVEEQRQWVAEAEIKGTPTLFFNNKQLPNTFDLDNLIGLPLQ